MAGRKKSRKIRQARADFPKTIAGFARKIAAVMVSKSLTTAHYVFDGAVGKSLVLVTLDPEITRAVLVTLEAMKDQGREVVPAEEVPDAGGQVDLEGVPLKGGLTGVILDGVTRKD